MTDSVEVELTKHHVRAIKAVLAASDEIAGEIEDQLPRDHEDAVLEFENKHREILAGLLTGYQGVYTEELPEGKEYHADFDVIREVEDLISV